MDDRHEIALRAWDRFVAPAPRGAAAPARSALRARRARADRCPDDRAAHRRARSRAQEERDVIEAELEGARARLPRRRRRRQRAALARALGLQPRAHAGDGRRLHVRRGHARPDRRDGGAGRRSRSGSRRPSHSVGRVSDGVEVRTRNGDVLRARTCVLTVPLNVLPHIALRRSLGGQARRHRARPGVARYKALVEG